MLEKILWNEGKKAFVKNSDGSKVSASAIGDPLSLSYDDGYWDYEDNKKEKIEEDILEHVKHKPLEHVNAYSTTERGICTSTAYSIQLFHID